MLREWSKAAGLHRKGRSMRACHRIFVRGQWPGLEPGYVVMSIEREAQMQNFKGYD